MRLITISMQNLKRRKARMAITALGLIIGVGAVVGLTGTVSAMTSDFDKKLGEYGTSIVIVPKFEQLSLSYGGVTVAGASNAKDFDLSVLARLERIDAASALRVIAPKSLGAVEVEGKKLLLVGVDFPAELRLKKWWKLIGRRPVSDAEIVLGNEAAAVLRKKAGDEISIRGNTFKVAARLEETGSFEDNLAFADINRVQAITGRPGRLNLIEVGAELTRYPIETIVAQIAKSVPEAEVTSFSPTVGSRDKTVEAFARFSMAVSAVVLLIGGLIVMSTMMSLVNERISEIGVFRAMGFRKRHIASIVFYEAAFVSLASGILGWLFGMGVALLLVPVLGKTDVSMRPDFRLLLLSVALAFLVGLAGSLYPARRAANFDPAKALRSI